jgi:FAD/FMN-containing dehydrogenase
MKIVKYFDIKFATRSGGRSPNPGWSSASGEVILLDMQKMNSVTLSSDGSVASVGPGARWGEVTDILDAQQATVVGGRIPIVGVAGLILGGEPYESP